MKKLFIIGTGPGSVAHLTDAARQAIAASTVVVGYDNYLELIKPLINGKETISTGMMREVERCREAIRRARSGETVCLVSGGDAGIYGMAGLVFELLENEADNDKKASQPDVQVIPGISAVQAAASVLGAPLMHDFSVISLSDLLTPWELIKTRLEAAARADFVIAIYNPRSKTRVTQIEEARRIILASRPAETPAGIVRNACRDDQSSVVTTLGELLNHDIDMSTIVIIGNASSFVDSHGRMVTPRGYARKYSDAAHSPTSESAGPLPDAATLMFCGTASDVGKSILTAGFCRSLLKRGLTVAPFKSQNMSLNSFVTPEGGEVGRAQAMQAQACNIPPHTDMNPVLLKPNSDTGSQIIVQGRPVANMNVREYDSYKPQAFVKIQESFHNLRQAYDFIVAEGAGSISEINLKENDIANMKIALMARCPVILVADIDRGGVFAQIAGTIDLLDPQEKAYIKGVIINKFRGDASILTPGIDFIQERTGVPVLGVLPWLPELCLPAEDSVILSQEVKKTALKDGQQQIRVGIIRLPRISNFTDFDQLQAEQDVILSYVKRPEQIEGLDILIIPGSKSTIGDLLFLREQGLFDAIARFTGRIIGICGGYQMLGTRVLDPERVESSLPEAKGFALLPVETTMLAGKETHQALARLEEPGQSLTPGCSDELSGYEIHMGRTDYTDTPRPFARIFQRGGKSVDILDGCVSDDGRVFGTYLHGIFDNTSFRDIYLNRIRSEKGMPLQSEETRAPVTDPFDLLSSHMEQHLDMPKLFEICGLSRDLA
ncbi:MAG: cobyric acid synthase [Desulfuromonadales bacterium]|nr:cobyric acid synthase [Desulfuromonadales bacterium]